MAKRQYNYYEERENFMHLSPRMTGLNNEVRVDVNHSFEMFRHPLIAYIPNTYSKWGKEFIVVTVEEHPKIVQFVDDLKLMVRDLNKTILWLKENRQLLRNVADGTIYNMDFVAILRTNREASSSIQQNRIYESQSHLNEMGVLNKNFSGLSFDIWLDQDELYKRGGHWRRLKVRPKNGTNDTHKWFSYILPTKDGEDGAFEKENEAKQFSGKEIKKLNKFINANLSLIFDLGDKIIDFDTFQESFLNLLMIKDGVTAKTADKNKKALFDVSIIEGTAFMTKMYVDEYGQKIYVITRQQEDEILTKEKYSYIFPNYREDERGKYVVAIDFFDKHNNIYLEDL